MKNTVQNIFVTLSIILLNLIWVAPVSAAPLVPASPDWAVRSIDLNDELPPYCTMRNTFPEANITLIFALDAEDNMSLAIDFSERLLETGQKYALQLNIPGKVSHQVVSEAASDRILVAQMGIDKLFMNSFASGRNFNIRMDGAYLSFALKGTSKSIRALEDCTFQLKDIEPHIDSIQTQKIQPKPRKSFVTMKENRQAIKSPNAEPNVASAPVTSVAQENKPAPAEQRNITPPKPAIKPAPAQTAATHQPSQKPTAKPVENAQPRAAQTQQVSATPLAIAQHAAVPTHTPVSQHPALQHKTPKKILEKKNGQQIVTTVSATKPLANQQTASNNTAPKTTAKPQQRFQSLSTTVVQKTPPVDDATDALEKMLRSALSISTLNKRKKHDGIFSWTTADLHGNAQIFDWPKGTSFMQMVQHYMTRAETRCKGSFAFKTGEALSLSGGDVYVSGDIACVGAAHDNAAAVFFHGQDNRFTVISHEGNSTQLYTALNKRDQLSNYVMKELAD